MMKMIKLLCEKLMQSVKSLTDILFPRICCVCQNRLVSGEKNICASCVLSLPYTRFNAQKDNPLERLLWGKLHLERASAYLFYHRGADSRNILFDLKYNNRPDVGYHLSRAMAAELVETNFFDGIDIIIPVPLAKKRLRHRGYNQDDWIAAGIARVTGIKIEHKAVERTKSNKTQTYLTDSERADNVEGIFSVKHPELLRGKHVLLIDDVITTGSTVVSCGNEIMSGGARKISLLVLATSPRVGKL